ncbi:hypothetical protein [Natrinema sp. SYSU A 869]|uniref:hypothetical protein n=1 Tax=Natrinema sp. SYSU A 869 TaxID=2871694 RepID=UPI001CA43FF0|nr:hypothetical protein [Natrinema sp. SYSU A 869]
MISGGNLLTFGWGVALILIANQVLKTATDWTVRQGFGWIKNITLSEGTSRDELEGNERALEIERRLRDQLERKKISYLIMSG